MSLSTIAHKSSKIGGLSNIVTQIIHYFIASKLRYVSIVSNNELDLKTIYFHLIRVKNYTIIIF